MSDTKTEKTVADELKTAARKLRDLAAKAPEGAWEWDGPIWGDGPGGPDTTSLIVTDPKRETVVLIPFAHEPGRHPHAEQAAPWIRMVNPLLAEPLASWLEENAKLFSRSTYEEPGFTVHAVCGGVIGGAITRCACFDKPLAVARVLNGTAQ